MSHNLFHSICLSLQLLVLWSCRFFHCRTLPLCNLKSSQPGERRPAQKTKKLNFAEPSHLVEAFASLPPIPLRHPSPSPPLFLCRGDSSRPGTAKATPTTFLLPPPDQLIMEAASCEKSSSCQKASRTQVQEDLIFLL